LGGGKSKLIFFGEEKSTETTTTPFVFAVKTFKNEVPKELPKGFGHLFSRRFQNNKKSAKKRCVRALRDERHEARQTGESKWSLDWSDMGVSKNRGTPKWMVKIMETPII